MYKKFDFLGNENVFIIFNYTAVLSGGILNSKTKFSSYRVKREKDKN